MKYILGPMKVPFLILTPMCILVGIATAMWSGVHVSVAPIVLIVVGAVCSHISVNALNEYHDFKSGLDSRTERTPFSGGSGTLQERPDKAPAALATGIISLLLCFSIGMYFVFTVGALLLPLGLLGVALIVFYTRWITKRPIICLVAPGLAFGPLMVLGTHFVLTGSYSWTAFLASLVPGFLVSALLLLNQFPDMDADKTVGRRHLVILLGRKNVARIYIFFLTASYVPIILGYALGVFPVHVFIALATIVLAVHTSRGVLRYSDEMKNLVPYLGKNVIIDLATPALLAIGLMIASS
ncbi:MAG: prenyltransferase [Syntrophorhabdaceae bacterium]|nr:prenyltransferase [Syntrophorhabdaceae bacterium]MDD4196655.1 prenyltransferase [Syntrophorhabdaceae bacterium]